MENELLLDIQEFVTNIVLNDRVDVENDLANKGLMEEISLEILGIIQDLPPKTVDYTIASHNDLFAEVEIFLLDLSDHGEIGQIDSGICNEVYEAIQNRYAGPLVFKHDTSGAYANE
jgi:hypothetical protein